METELFQETSDEDRDILMIFLMKDFIKNHSLENLSDDIFSGLLKKNFIKSKNFSNDRLEVIKKNILQNFPSKKSRFLKDFTILDKIGNGGFGSVFKVYNKLDKKKYAVKIVNINHENKDIVVREVENLSTLNHPNVIRYYGSWIEDVEMAVDTQKYLDYGEESIGSEYSNSGDPGITNYLFLQMELAETNLKEIQNNLNYTEKKEIFKEIVYGLDAIHDQSIIHRDLKPANILMINGRVKIGDFGLSKSLSDNRLKMITIGEETPELTGDMGSMLYSSPEQLNGEEYDYRTDIYSLGIIMYDMLNNFDTEMERSIKIRDLKKNKEEELVKKYPDELKFIKILINLNYKLRPNTKKILEMI